MRFLLASLSLALVAVPAQAEPGLPEEEMVAAALDDHPSVAAARARLEASRAEARGLRKGPHELTFSGSYNRRSIDREGRYDEYDAQLTRALRLPGKARLDRAIGRFGVEAAENAAEDARHQAALLLAGHWFDWLSASAQAQVDRTAVENYEKSLVAPVLGDPTATGERTYRVIDFFDGIVARVTRRETRLGEILDMEFDGLGLLIAVALAVQYGKLPPWYLLLGVSRPLFVLGIWLRQRAAKPVYDLPPSDHRRVIAGLHTSFVAAALWPVLASTTSNTSCGAVASTLPETRLIFLSSSIRFDCVCRRPAVSAMTTSTVRALAD